MAVTSQIQLCFCFNNASIQEYPSGCGQSAASLPDATGHCAPFESAGGCPSSTEIASVGGAPKASKRA